MNIFGLGPLEILLIMIIALIVFGPAKLPEIMGQVGKAIADFRRATSALSDEFNRTIQTELQETRAIVDDTKSAVTGVHTTINSAIAGAAAPVRTAAPGDAATVVSGANGTNGTATAQVTPPLADTSQWSWETSSGSGVGVAASAPATATATAEAPRPYESSAEQVPEPQIPSPPTRKSNARDVLLPPY
jgi:TatA/E family protein of Tat protein translocase